MSVIPPPKAGTIAAPWVRSIMAEGDQLAQRMAAFNEYKVTDAPLKRLRL